MTGWLCKFYQQHSVAACEIILADLFVQHSIYLSRSLAGRWGTTVDVTTLHSIYLSRSLASRWGTTVDVTTLHSIYLSRSLAGRWGTTVDVTTLHSIFLSRSLAGRWGTTVDVTTSLPHSSREPQNNMAACKSSQQMRFSETLCMMFAN